MTVAECLERAAECDRLAEITDSKTAHHVMRAAAAQWRRMAEATMARERSGLAALAAFPNSARPN